MPQLNMNPEFTSEEVKGKEEEVKEIPTEEVVEEKETPTEPPAEQTTSKEPIPPVEEPQKDPIVEAVARATEGLRGEIVDLRKRLAAASGQKRDVIQQEIIQKQQDITELQDVAPEDVTLVEKILRSKGYVTQAEVKKMTYDSVKNEELNKFLEKYPEYKPENDLNDVNWRSLQQELGFYKMPEDPRLIGTVLERAHRTISRTSTTHNVSARKRQVEVASTGSGGVQRTRSTSQLDPEKVAMLKQGGFTDEDIRNMESRL